MHRQTIIKGALILTLANILTRIAGFFYRIYMVKAIGAEGMGLYQLITPLYLLVWSASASGISTAISKLVAQEKAKGLFGNVKRILHSGIFLTTVASSIFSLIFYFHSEEIALYIIKDMRTALSLRIISICFPFMSVGSVLRGYYLGIQNTTISAISQVLEQIVRMVVVYLLSGTMIPKGLEYACGAAVWGMAIGEILSFVFVFVHYNFNGKFKVKPKLIITKKSAMAMLLSMAIPLTLNRVASALFGTAENLLIPARLQVYGLSQSESISLLGRLTGMAMPLITFPSSLLTALATALMPAISESYALKNNVRIKSSLYQSLNITAIVSMYTTFIFIVFSNEIGILIYSQSEIGQMLKTLAIICPFIYTQVTLSAVLNGLGEQLFIFKTGITSSIINIGAIYFAIPIYGITGFIYPWIINTIFFTFANIMKISKRININLPIILIYIKPAMCSILACLIARLGLICIWNNTSYNLGVILTIVFSITVYLFLIFACGCIKRDDIRI